MTIVRCETHSCDYDEANGCSFCPSEVERLRARVADLEKDLKMSNDSLAIAMRTIEILTNALNVLADWLKTSGT